MADDKPLSLRDRARRFGNRLRSVSPLPPKSSINATSPSSATPATESVARDKHDQQQLNGSPPPKLLDIPVVTSSAHPTLLADAMSKLSPQYRKIIEDWSNNQNDVFHTALQRAHELQEQCDKQTWRWQFRGYEVVPREMASSICHFLKSVQPLGDTLAGLDPIHAGLPWSGVKMIIETSLASERQRSQLMKGLEYVLSYSKRLAIYVRLPSDNIHETLVETYACILEFLAAAIQTYESNSVKRTAQAMWKLPALTDFAEKLEKCRDKLREDAQNDVNEEFRNQLSKLDVLQSSIQAIDDNISLTALTVIANAKHDSVDNSRKGDCLDGTRVDLLQSILDWAASPAERIFWLCGKAGTGKSTVARTVASRLEREILVSFFFERTDASRSDATSLFSTLAGQLLVVIPSMKPFVAAALQRDRSICTSRIDNQFRTLLEQPLRASQTTADIYVVLDALDECYEGDVKQVLDLLSGLTIPGICFRIFITSRPEVGRKFDNNMDYLDLRLEEVQELTIRHDLRRFIDDSFKSMKRPRVDNWPEDSQLEALTDLCTPLFIAASTYCQYISQNPKRRLAEIIEQRPAIEQMYLPILRNMLNSMGAEALEEFRSLVGPIVMLEKPLSLEALAALLELDLDDFDTMLDHLESILDLRGEITFHLSFRDYLLNPNAEHEFHINEEDTQWQLFKHCIRVLDSLHYDMCQVQDIGTLRKGTKPSVSDDIKYACLFWTQHATDVQEVDDFLHRGLLNWIEVMSWLDEIPKAISDLVKLTRRCPENKFLSDAVDFVCSQRDVIELAPLQVYISALHYTSSASLVKRCYIEEFKQRAGEWLEHFPPDSPQGTATWSRSFGVLAACMSHDMNYVALVVRYDEVVLHCDARTGSTLQSFDMPPSVGDDFRAAYSQDDSTLIVSSRHAIVAFDLMTGSKRMLYQTGRDIHTLSADGTFAIIVDESHSASDNAPIFSGLLAANSSIETWELPPYNGPRCLPAGSTMSCLRIPTRRLATLLDVQQMIDLMFVSFSDYGGGCIIAFVGTALGNISCETAAFRIWDTSANLLHTILPTADDSCGRFLTAFTLSQDGQLAMNHTPDYSDQADGTTALYNVQSGQRVCAFKTFGQVDNMHFIDEDTADVSIIHIDHRGSAQRWRIDGAHAEMQLHEHYAGQRNLYMASFNNCRSAIFTSSKSVSMTPLILLSIDLVSTSYMHKSLILERSERGCAFVGKDRSKVGFWHIDGSRLGPTLDHGTTSPLAILSATLSPGNLFALTVSCTETEIMLKLWLVDTGLMTKEQTVQVDVDFTLTQFRNCAISMDGRFAAVLWHDQYRGQGYDGDPLRSCYYLVDMNSGDVRRYPQEYRYLENISMSFSPDSTALVSVETIGYTEEYGSDAIRRCMDTIGCNQTAAHLTGIQGYMSVHWEAQSDCAGAQCSAGRLNFGNDEIHCEITPPYEVKAHMDIMGRWLMLDSSRYMFAPPVDPKQIACKDETVAVMYSLEELSIYKFRARNDITSQASSTDDVSGRSDSKTRASLSN